MAKLITGLSRQQELAYQQRQIERLARTVERSMTREILATMARYADLEGNFGLQAQEIAEHKARLEQILRRDYEKAYDLFGSRTLEAGLKSHGIFETKDAFEDLDLMREEWIATMTALKVTPIGGTTEKQAQRIIANATAAGLQMGLAQAELGEMIRSDIRTQGGTLARARARVIARTESHAASNAAQQQAAVATGLPMLKEWVAANQPDRTRQDHQDADGQTVELHMPFIVGGEELMQPGDPTGSAEQVINCRCVSVFVVQD